MTRDELIHQLALMIAGLQVPLSMPFPGMLGVAEEPYRAVLGEIKSFGWIDAEEAESVLRERLSGTA